MGQSQPGCMTWITHCLTHLRHTYVRAASDRTHQSAGSSRATVSCASSPNSSTDSLLAAAIRVPNQSIALPITFTAATVHKCDQFVRSRAKSSKSADCLVTGSQQNEQTATSFRCPQTVLSSKASLYHSFRLETRCAHIAGSSQPWCCCQKGRRPDLAVRSPKKQIDLCGVRVSLHIRTRHKQKYRWSS